MQDPRLSPAQKVELEVEIEAEVGMMIIHISGFYNSQHSLASAEAVISYKITSIAMFWWLQVEILWRTDEMRATKPTVLEEIVTGLDYFRYSLFEAVCTTYRYAENSVNVSNFPVNFHSLKLTLSLGAAGSISF